MTSIKDSKGMLLTDQTKILQRTEEFYQHLYESNAAQNTRFKDNRIVNVNSEDIPEIEIFEIENALKKIKNNTSAGEDNILPEMLKAGGITLLKQLQILLNDCLEKGTIPSAWNNAVLILLFKKGDKSKLENYRPISLLSQIYKLFTKVLTNRLTKKLDLYQPCEQAGFREGYSTVDHIQTLRTIFEKSREYNLPLYLAFVDFEKAFDSIETWAILTSLQNSRIDHRYTNLIKHIYANATMTIKLQQSKTNVVKMGKGVRQGDTLSPKLFTLCLEDVFKKVNWDDKGLNIDGTKLNHLRFADDIVLMADNLADLKQMLTDLHHKSKEIGLKMNRDKTKVMCNEALDPYAPIKIEDVAIEEVDSYIYLGQHVSLKKCSQEDEINRRIRAGWAAFHSWRDVLKGKLDQKLKTRLFNQNILPVLTYASETWTLTQKSKNKLQVTQRAMERAMLGISLKHHKTNEWIRNKTKVHDVLKTILQLKWSWAGHVARSSDRWTKRVLQWRPRTGKRFRGRPPMRWTDDIKRSADYNWIEKAQSRELWRELGEAYIRNGLR